MAKTRVEIQAKYDAAHRQTITINLHNDNDAEIINKLNSVQSKQGYIKQLIREDIARTCSVPKQSASVPVSFKDPYSDKVTDAIGTWVDKEKSVFSNSKPLIIDDSVPFGELIEREKNK